MDDMAEGQSEERRGEAGTTLDRAPSLADMMARRLQDDIAARRYRPGAKLPSEAALADMYGVSRATVRDAIGRLKHDGLVTSRQGQGAFVAASGAPSVFRLDVADFSDRQEIAHIVELLVAVEGAAAEHAARRRTDAQLAAITVALDAMQAAIDRHENGADEDFAFHQRIIEATGNPFFRALSDFLDTRVRSFIRTARANSARQEGMATRVQAEHVAIHDAIAAGDGAAARNAAERHVINAAARLAIYLGR